MSDYDNTNTGALFKNDKKESNTQPDYKGSVNINGVEFWQSAWIKTSKTGVKFISQSFKPKDEQKAVKVPEPVAADPFGDDVPF